MAAATLIGALAGTTVRADPVPAQVLQDNHQSCMTACAGQGKTAAFCQAYCDCSAKATGDSFSAQEYQALSDALAKHQPPAPASLDKLKVIIGRCGASTPQ